MANLAGSAVVAAWGAFARVPARCVVAWIVAWPLVQFGLSLQPELRHYGGLSGVLHAGVTIVAVHLVCSGSRMQRRVATAVLAGTIVKLLSESPWSGPISHPPGWDIPVAPGGTCQRRPGGRDRHGVDRGHRTRRRRAARGAGRNRRTRLNPAAGRPAIRTACRFRLGPPWGSQALPCAASRLRRRLSVNSRCRAWCSLRCSSESRWSTARAFEKRTAPDTPASLSRGCVEPAKSSSDRRRTAAPAHRRPSFAPARSRPAPRCRNRRP